MRFQTLTCSAEEHHISGLPSVAKTADKAKGIQGKKDSALVGNGRIIEEKQPKIVLLENVDRQIAQITHFSTGGGFRRHVADWMSWDTSS